MHHTSTDTLPAQEHERARAHDADGDDGRRLMDSAQPLKKRYFIWILQSRQPHNERNVAKDPSACRIQLSSFSRPFLLQTIHQRTEHCLKIFCKFQLYENIGPGDKGSDGARKCAFNLQVLPRVVHMHTPHGSDSCSPHHVRMDCFQSHDKGSEAQCIRW